MSKDNDYEPGYGCNPISFRTGTIYIPRKTVRMKGSDLIGSHEYSHAMTDAKRIKKLDKGTMLEVLKANKAISKEDGFDKLSRDAIRKNKIKNKHDKKPDEMRADYYAITTTKGENNSNRLRKILNEQSRREYQSMHDKTANKANKAKDIIESDDCELPKVKKKIYTKALSRITKSSDKRSKKLMDKTKKVNLTRQKTNDYIVSKKKEK